MGRLKKALVNMIRFLHQEEKQSQKENNFQGKGLKKIALVGTPNVGKSVIFNRLTGAYVVVSNYPGTTVEVSRGKARFGGKEYEVVDTPGMYSLMPISEEERVTRTLLMRESPELVLHVVDAKNIERMLPLTVQLLEAGLKVMLVINMLDEAREKGIRIDFAGLERELQIPVLGTVAAANLGIGVLRKRVAEFVET